MASLLSAGDVLVQYDQAYERYDTPNPQQLAADLATTPPGLTDPVSYGTPRPNVPLIPHFDEAALALPANQGWPSPLVSYTVTDPRPIVRTESTGHPAGGRRGRQRHRRRRLGRACWPATRPSSTPAPSTPTRSCGRPTLGAAGRPGGDRHQPQAGLSVELPQREHRLHRDGRPGARHVRPERRTRSTSSRRPRPTPRPPRCCDGVSSVTASSYGSSITYLPEDRPVRRPRRQPPDGLGDQLLRRAPVGQWWQVVLRPPQHRAAR